MRQADPPEREETGLMSQMIRTNIGGKGGGVVGRMGMFYLHVHSPCYTQRSKK